MADPNVVGATETSNNKEKIKLRKSMFNLKHNNKNTEHLLPMTRSSTDFPKVASTTILINAGNKLIIAVLKTQFKNRKYKKIDLPSLTLYRHIFLYNPIRLCVKSLWTRCYIPCSSALPTRVHCFLLCRLVSLLLSLNLIKIFAAAFGPLSAFISSFLRTFSVQIKCRLVFSRRVM